MKVVLIDADSLLYITCYKYKDSNNLEDYIKAIDEWIHNIITTCEGDRYIGALTLGKVFRHKIAKSKEYKSGRSLDRPKFYYELRKYLIDAWKFISYDGLEAEDLIAINATYLKENFWDYVICHIDHDLNQLEGKHFDFRKNTFFEVSSFFSEWNLWKQVCTGCQTDSIPGIKGFGDKKAEGLLISKTIEDCKNLVLKEYIKCYGLKEGMDRFNETFQLCYLLRYPKEVDYVYRDLNLGHYVSLPLIPKAIDYIPINTNNQDLTIF